MTDDERGVPEMSDTKAQPEPTMEEILASIRRIISENDEEGRPVAPVGGIAPEDNVLELTDMVADDGSVVSLNAPLDEPAADADEDMGDDIPPVPDDGVAADEDEDSELTMEDADDNIEFSPEELIGQPKAVDEGLMSAAAAGATAAAFAALARSSQSGNGGLSLGSGRTLEDLVQEMIRPMIKEWLDKNLPPMAERLVRKELERLSRRAED
jgi:cell pole-organizing protein PopZ